MTAAVITGVPAFLIVTVPALLVGAAGIWRKDRFGGKP